MGKFQPTLSVIKLQSTWSTSGRNSGMTFSQTHIKINVVPDHQVVTNTVSLEQKG